MKRRPPEPPFHPSSFRLHPFLILRLYEAVVAVLSLVEDAQTVCVRVAEDYELVAVVGQRHHGLFGRHRLNLVAAGGDDAGLPAVGPVAVIGGRLRGGRGGVVGRDGGHRRRGLPAIDYLLTELERLLLYLVYAARERLIHVGVGVPGGERVLAPVK